MPDGTTKVVLSPPAPRQAPARSFAAWVARLEAAQERRRRHEAARVPIPGYLARRDVHHVATYGAPPACGVALSLAPAATVDRELVSCGECRAAVGLAPRRCACGLEGCA